MKKYGAVHERALGERTKGTFCQQLTPVIIPYVRKIAPFYLALLGVPSLAYHSPSAQRGIGVHYLYLLFSMNLTGIWTGRVDHEADVTSWKEEAKGQELVQGKKWICVGTNQMTYN